MLLMLLFDITVYLWFCLFVFCFVHLFINSRRVLSHRDQDQSRVSVGSESESGPGSRNWKEIKHIRERERRTGEKGKKGREGDSERERERHKTQIK